MLKKKSLIVNDVFNTKSLCYLTEYHPVKVEDASESNEIIACPRNGLNLKTEYDAQKDLFWMADYRFLTRPDLLPCVNLVQFAMLMRNDPIPEIIKRIKKGSTKTLQRYQKQMRQY